MSRLLFLNLPVTDLTASRAFFAALGFEFNEKFCDEGAACMVVSEQGYVMLLQRDRFADFITKPIAGATTAKDPQDYGFMYQRSFHDLDGHHWEVAWMDPVAVEKGPAEFAAGQAAANGRSSPRGPRSA